MKLSKLEDPKFETRFIPKCLSTSKNEDLKFERKTWYDFVIRKNTISFTSPFYRTLNLDSVMKNIFQCLYTLYDNLKYFWEENTWCEKKEKKHFRIKRTRHIDSRSSKLQDAEDESVFTVSLLFVTRKKQINKQIKWRQFRHSSGRILAWEVFIYSALNLKISGPPVTFLSYRRRNTPSINSH